MQRLGAFTASCRDDGIPDEVARSVRQRVADILGVAVAAQRLDTSEAAVRYVLSQGGAEQSRVLGQRRKVPAAQAAFANGVLAHSLDYDDTHLPSVLHPSASVVPAALAIGEAQGSSGAEIAAAVAAGLEICVRLGMAGYDHASRNSVFFQLGQHATSICGTIGAAAAAASLLGLDADGIAHAMGVSVSFAGGVLEGNRTGGTVKRAHCGWAAHGGVTAAELAAAGFTGPPTVLEGKFGFFQAFINGRFDPAPLEEGLGVQWEVPGIFFKPYPANHFTHAGIDAAIRMREAGLRPQDVESVVLGTAAHAARTIGEPIEVKRRPKSGYQGQFSGPYTVAAALFGGSGLGLGLADFTDDLVNDPGRQELMAKIDVVGDPFCDDIFPYQFPAILRVHTVDGRDLEERVLTTRGGPERPLSDDEIRRKLLDNVEGFVNPESAQRLGSVAERSDGLDDVSDLLAATVRVT
ncbi:MmgE/PrpD family protein [Georgenia sp. 10Sc9-8]|uniref:MmgE/PrpD family protein n=1 Tax=Georgenia halotolerans TaxID=3028317 RepID=A0ABT5TZR1_9MICO|nr:MmgE/PrpD family protein [Georgenia halotolerans]